MIRRTLLAASLFIGASTSVLAEDNPVNSSSADVLKEKAKQCRTIVSKVERLSCFDNLFGTPVAGMPADPELVRPEPWQRAVKSETLRNGHVGWLRNENIGSNGEKALWFTVTANPRVGSVEAPVILMASCISKISRLEILFPEIQEGVRADVSLGSGRRIWMFDEQGMVLRSGRGLSAISIMRPLVQAPKIHIRSNADRIDGLIFETKNGKAAITELRELCRW